MRIGTGPGPVPGTAALLRGVGPPESECVLGAARPFPWKERAASAADSQAGSRGTAVATAAVTPEPTQKSVIVPGKGNYCLLTSRAL